MQGDVRHMAGFLPGGCPEGGPSTSLSWHLVSKWEQNVVLGGGLPGGWDRREAESIMSLHLPSMGGRLLGVGVRVRIHGWFSKL